MKQYQPRRTLECPLGAHPPYDPADPHNTDNCTCEWLLAQSTTPEPHVTSWNRRELDTFLREADRGYFDPPDYPARKGSMFVSPHVQHLIDNLTTNPLRALVLVMAGLIPEPDYTEEEDGGRPFVALAWDAHTTALSFYQATSSQQGWHWIRLTLPDDDGDGDGRPEQSGFKDGSVPYGFAPVILWQAPERPIPAELKELAAQTPDNETLKERLGFDAQEHPAHSS